MATVTVALVPNLFTSLGSGPMLIRTAAPIGISASGTGAPLPNAAITAISANDVPFSVPMSEVFYGIALQQSQPGQPAVVVNVSVTT